MDLSARARVVVPWAVSASVHLGDHNPDGPAAASGQGGRHSSAAPQHWRAMENSGRFRELVRAAMHVDVLLIDPWGTTAMAYVAARIAGRGVVAYSQGVADNSLEIFERREWNRKLTRWALRRLDAVACVSTEGRKGLLRLGVDESRIVEIRPGIDVDALRERATNSPALAVDGRWRHLLVGCGVLSRHKGFDMTLRALASLRENGLDVGLVLIGAEGNAANELYGLIDELALHDAVVFITESIDPMPYFRMADAVVHAARVEAQGLVLIEALAVGAPVIAHRATTGGPQEILDGGAYGALIDATIEGVYADTIRAHLEDPEPLQARAAAAEGFLRRRYSIPEGAAIAADLFRSIAHSRGRGIRRWFPRPTLDRGSAKR